MTVARLIYAALASLDGYVADEDGRFDWAEPTPEVHAFVNDLDGYSASETRLVMREHGMALTRPI